MSVKTKTTQHNAVHRKRLGQHHKHSKQYKQVYWPFMPMLVSLLIFGLTAFSFFQSSAAGVLAYATDMTQGGLLNATNNHRSADGKGALSLSSQLSSAAQAKADDMIARNYWSHTTPDGQQPWVFIDSTGYKYQKAGENLAYGFTTSSSAVTGWMNSPTHKANMLDGDYTEVGFGYANGVNYNDSGQQTVVVAMYGRPQTLGSSTQPTPAPTSPSPVSKPRSAPTPAPAAAPTQTEPEAVAEETAEQAETEPAASSESGVNEDSQTVSRVQALTGGRAAWAPMFIGLLGGGTVTMLLTSHTLRLRKLLRKGEHYFATHPLFDVMLVAIALMCLELSKTVGFIQ